MSFEFKAALVIYYIRKAFSTNSKTNINIPQIFYNIWLNIVDAFKYLFSFILVTKLKQEKNIPGNNKSTFWNVTLTTFNFGIYIYIRWSV